MAMVIAACAAGPAGTLSPTLPATPRPAPSLTPSPTTAPTPAASSAAQVVPLPREGPNLFPGTYSTSFDPPLTLTIGREVDLDCVAGYECRGDIDVNLPDWLDFEFGNDHGSELMIFGFDMLFDPEDPSRLIEPPADFAAWLAGHDGVSILGNAHDLLVGGIPAIQVDVETDDQGLTGGPADVPEFPTLGLGPNVRARLTALRAGGRQVWIVGMLGNENKVGDYEAAVDGLQGIIDSITWAPGTNGQIVFEDAGENYVGTQIWIENADGSGTRRLVYDDFTDSGPVLSPDGDRVVFYQAGDVVGRIMMVNSDGSGLHEIATGSPARGCDAGVEGDGWSPDGTRFAITQTCFDASQNFLGQGLLTIAIDGSDARVVTDNSPANPCPPPYANCAHLEDHRAAWSPDGSRLVFQRIDTSVDPERSAIFTIGYNGDDLRQVTPWELDANDPDWSPDGALIAFNAPAEAGGNQNIYVIAPDGTGVAQLTHGLSTYADGGQATYHPTWSPDGSQILFSHAPATDGFADLFVMNRDGSDLHVIAATALHENHATWGGGR